MDAIVARPFKACKTILSLPDFKFETKICAVLCSIDIWIAFSVWLSLKFNSSRVHCNQSTFSVTSSKYYLCVGSVLCKSLVNWKRRPKKVGFLSQIHSGILSEIWMIDLIKIIFLSICEIVLTNSKRALCWVLMRVSIAVISFWKLWRQRIMC